MHSLRDWVEYGHCGQNRLYDESECSCQVRVWVY
ncbi:Uncharacterized protein LW94_1594 [Fusarium fujikuroi]|nr:Uncharacterized protein LW93_5676 [Fusarium fujikuroi]KLO93630.1 Uncharacterized protein Y057_12199 [Fusarium fujikuroi]KLP15144.1 Uncharacterized protein LW94_1594 [Fusarium fujikuroi]